MFSSVAVLLLVTFLPGYALCKILDASADRLRRFALAPALGLLLTYGLSGLVLLTGPLDLGFDERFVVTPEHHCHLPTAFEHEGNTETDILAKA